MKTTKILLTVLLVALFGFFALGSGEEETVEQEKGSVAAEEAETNIGNYSVVIDSCRMAKDYEGNKVVIVKYIYKNVNSDDATGFDVAFMDRAYQNGVELNKAYMLDDSANYDADNQSKAIKKGASLDVEVAYELNDTTSDVDVEVEEFISFNDTVVKKTFTLPK